MIEFYDNDMSVCAQKVRLVLSEKQLPFERHHLNLRAGDQFDPKYLQLNPNAVVPTIVDDGHVIIDSSIIIDYLDDAYPRPALKPESPLLRATLRRWVVLPDVSLHRACGKTSFALAFRHQFAHFDSDALASHMRKIPDTTRRQTIQMLIEGGMNAPGLDDAVRIYARAIRTMADTLYHADWLAGESYSLADTTMLPYVLRLKHLGLDWFWEGAPQVADWFERSCQRDSFAAISEHLDEKYLQLMASTPAEDLAWVRRQIQS